MISARSVVVPSNKPTETVRPVIKGNKKPLRPAIRKPSPARVLYFAFGANVNPDVVRRRGIRPVKSEKCTCLNYKLVFNNIGGYGNIEYRPGQQDRPDVEGVLHDISAEEMRKLNFIEGGYDVRKVFVSTAENETAEAEAFMSNWSVRLFKETKPTAQYITKIRAGAEAFDFSPEYQAWLASVEASKDHRNQRNAWDSPASFLAAGFAFTLLTAATALLVRPSRI